MLIPTPLRIIPFRLLRSNSAPDENLKEIGALSLEIDDIFKTMEKLGSHEDGEEGNAGEKGK